MRPFRTWEKIVFALKAPAMAKDFARIPYLSRQEILKIQNERFLRVVRHAFKTVPYYQKKYSAAGVKLEDIQSVSDIEKLPILEKEELIRHYEELHSTSFKRRSALYEFVTGGTTGETVRIAHCPTSMHATLVSFHRAYAHMMNDSYPGHYRCAYVYTGEYPFSDFFGRFPMDFIWTLDDMEVIKQKLFRSGPAMITAYPSTIERLTEALTEGERVSLSQHLKVISTNSEMSSQQSRDDLAEEWGVPVLDTFCSEEISTMIFNQCIHKQYHVNEDCCVLEATDELGRQVSPGQEGQLVCTSLWNFAMPLIRYNQRDRVSLNAADESSCNCGYNFQTVNKFLGRINDAFTLPSGRVLDSGYLLDIGYSTLVKYRDAIQFWSLIQEAPDKVTLECVFSSCATNELLSLMAKDLSPFFHGECEVSVKSASEPRRSKKGKYRQIISEVNPSSPKAENAKTVIPLGCAPLPANTM